MQPAIVSEAVEWADEFLSTRGRSGRGRAARRFARALASVPDCAGRACSLDDVAGLQSVSELVIARLEREFGAAGSAAERRVLVASVYAIRRALEQLDTYRRHEAARRTSS